MELIAEKYKQTDIGSIPIDWEILTIDELVSKGLIEKPLDGNHGNIHPKSSDFVNSGIPFVMANNIYNGIVDLINCHYIRKEQADNLQKGFSLSGDVLLTHKGTVGNVAIVGKIETEYIMLTPQVTYYRVKKPNGIINSYIKQYFQSDTFQKIITKISGGGTRAYIGIISQGQLPFILPPFQEQMAIASTLSDADSYIGSLEKLLAKKRFIKQGAMQELLKPKEGWELKKLGELLKIRHGKSQKEVEDTNGQYPILGTGGLMSYTNQFLYDKPSVLIGRKGTIDKPQFMDKPFWTVDTLFFTEINNNISPKFIYYRFLLIDWYSHNEASGVPSLNAKTIENIEISIPSHEEQTRIASILSDMDAEITTLETKLGKARNIKQGMMQELLTGKIRLNH